MDRIGEEMKDGGGQSDEELPMCMAECLKAKIKEWHDRLNGEDVHAIRRQISNMLWWSAFYRSVNESRCFLPDDGKGGKLANATLHGLVNAGYVTMHATAVRRLLDKSPSSGPRGVNSLYALIEDIRDSCDLLTRRLILAARDLPYDYEPVKEKACEQALVEAADRGKSPPYPVSREGWADTEYWHETWDKLCDTSKEARSPDDHPGGACFQHCLDSLEREATAVTNYVNKFIAHAATPRSIASLPTEEHGLSLDKLWNAERAIVSAANFVSRCFVSGANLGGVPTPQFDQFEHLNRPFIDDAALPTMENAWKAHRDEIDACREWSWTTPLTDSPL